MIDHVSLGVRDRAVAFYEATFAPLGLTKLVTRPTMVGFGKTYPEIWINLRRDTERVPDDVGSHICLRARTVAEIDAFYAAALQAGGSSESAPSRRPHDRVIYYAAFIRDPDGHRIEAVTFPSV